MKKIITFTLLFIILSVSQANSQSSNIEFVFKAGGNYAKFTPDFTLSGMKVTDYRRKLGFYIGGFLSVRVTEKLKFQPELLFSIQGTRVLVEDIEIRDTDGEITISDFKSNINEMTISIPLALRYFFTKSFFIDGGPQLGYIIDRNEKIKENPFEQFDNPGQPIEFDYDKFDLGLTIGTGYNISETITLNGRFFFGLIERDNAIKTSVFNLGLEYKL